MFLKRRALLALGLITGLAWASPNVLNNSPHAADSIRQGVVAILGAGVLDTTVMVDMSSNVSGFTSPMTTFATDTMRVDYSSLDSSPVNHAPYVVISNSFSGYTASIDFNAYAVLTAGGIIDTWAYVPGASLAAGTSPPIAATTVLTTGSSNNPGLEFGITPGYKGLTITTASAATGVFSGFLVSMRYQHPTWSWGDIKGALRQTASNWATGYNPTASGYGAIDYDAATAVASTSAIYLQPPGMTIMSHGYYATVSLYPFRSTRRVRELLYSVNPAYSWPVKNEYDASDIAASGATLLFSSNGTDVIPTFDYVPAATGTITFVAFTTDDAGHYSRVEANFSKQQVSLTKSTQCAAL